MMLAARPSAPCPAGSANNWKLLGLDASGGASGGDGRRRVIAAEVARCHLLGIRHVEERQVITVIEHPEPSANHGLAVRGVGQPDSRLPTFVVRGYVGCQARLVIPPHAGIQRQLAGDPPLVLKEKSPIAMVNLTVVIPCQ